mgnify:CR=1 FL=1
METHNTRAALVMLLIATVVLLTPSMVAAVGGTYAFGYYGNETTLIKEHRAHVWTGTPPSGQVWAAAPLAVCEQYDCGGKIVETGWIKGTAWDLGDVLQQYVTYEDVDGSRRMVFHLGNLSQDVWYQFKVIYSNTASRWEAWCFDDVVWYAPRDLGWTRGRRVVAGSENNNAQGWMDVWGWHPEYKPDPGDWTLYNYSYSQVAGGGSIEHAYDYGYHAWGPQ